MFFIFILKIVCRWVRLVLVKGFIFRRFVELKMVFRVLFWLIKLESVVLMDFRLVMLMV